MALLGQMHYYFVDSFYLFIYIFIYFYYAFLRLYLCKNN